MRSARVRFAGSNAVALVLSAAIAACGDDSGGEEGAANQGSEGTKPAVAVGMRIESPEGRQIYVGAFPSVPTGTVTTDGMAEFGNVYTSTFDGHLFVWDRESFEVKKFGFTDDLKFIELGRVSFAEYGSGFEFGNAFTSPTRGLIPHVPSGKLIVWDPTAMAIVGTQPLNMPTREGFDTFPGDPIVANGRVIWPICSTNEEAGKLYPVMSALVVAGDGASAPKLIDDTRCLPAIQGVATKAGDAYLFGDGYSGNSNYWLEGVANPPPACILRLKDGADSFDPDYLLNMNTTTGSPAIAQNFRIDDTRIVLRMWDPSLPLAPIDGYFSSQNFVSKLIDLSQPQATATDFAPIPKGGATSNVQSSVDGVVYIELPKADKSGNDLFQLHVDKLVPSFSIPGDIWQLSRLR